MNTTPLFTIVIATHSRATILDQKVLPALEQLTYPYYEVVIVDDASSDDTVNVLRRWEARLNNFRQLRNSKNRGATSSRNLGVAQAKGEIIVLMDDDVIIAPDCLNQLAKIYLEDPELMTAWGAVQHEGKDVAFGNGSLWSMRRKVFDVLRFDTNLRYFGTSNNDEHEFARRIQKEGFKIIEATEAKAYHLAAHAPHRKYKGLGGDLNYQYEMLKGGSIWQYYAALLQGFFLLFNPSLETINQGSTYKQALCTFKKVLIFLKEGEFTLAVQWLFYVLIDIPLRAKTKGLIEVFSRNYSKSWPA